MRRDPIFYQMFQRFPQLLFDLIGAQPDNAEEYRFDCVAVKEPKFEIDGVFLPPDSQPGTVYFCEVQFQKDEELYERLFGESLLYFYRNCNQFDDWQAVVIYPSRSIEQSKVYPHRSLLNGEQVHRIYLDELTDVRSLPVTVAATVLTIAPEAQAPELARELLSRTEQEEFTARERGNIIDIITSIMVYKFANLSQGEIRAMLGLDLTQEPRAIREAKEEGRVEGREVEALALITRLLTRRLGLELSDEMRSLLSTLPLSVLEDLSEALLDFTTLADLEHFLAEHLEPKIVD
ncbi:Rpn family recombination-promoting nuclease/putative transposase [Scytonema sp. NUACC26]|uniref:Rpn family recombination-promoting nuclease/putative transposase n=1 Tax=Scytonema sp. NUACC26 TaxID=3140176 RepID=UPI0034DBE49C